ncbi:uncharacterized protein LOC105228483 isoform X1 [Bactrocera dorsalis]|uniref:Uncharacterized protein LOC105228483 isoform X1 n=1 Tax=Bactrocera dorsalis TaxID=27457 RepID=A0ABM3JRP1_BACDO|nr:uncharacterized protein LOC105228483 isoform X1 [Bactrocera dorsalis]XP_049311899.1 uncharacterized protein LOC105228483 isoform X1 [Bactrocera dorsalis]XP_049311900.1 uncharacterized protein LOC105228483 isoform X1 [Bactrocera dorsalis]XP_049311901.1 uncharacterized protein LOC105228483 isoform X1 [Bactrocera dorsalis]XP_049311902.1 uncharacterized protein LOC105228483 isoform X1 [Bactrocera dorsalis]
MSESCDNTHLKFIKEYVVPKILTQLQGETLLKFELEHASGLDGFMSALYNIKFHTQTADGAKQRLLVAKFMKGDVSFRESSKSYIQFANEIFVYERALPAFAKVLAAAKLDITIDDWVPHPYVAKFGYIEGLSAAPGVRESVLVLEHLKPRGYVLGPRLYLTREHLLPMCRTIGQYHAISYALRLIDPTQLESLKSEIVTLPFINDADPRDAQDNFYRYLYRAAFDRFYDFFDRKIDGNTFDKQNADDLKLIERLRDLRAKYIEEPTRLLEKIRTGVVVNEQDKHFGAILHGDYNRNNVLFRYEAQEAGDTVASKVADVKMIDFQEMRYGSPCLDLSFFMYMNTTEETRDAIWQEMLQTYHTNMFNTLQAAVKGNASVDAAQLATYSFEAFQAHFKRYAFYGVMICLHFLPWMLSSEEECAKISHLFETNLRGEEFHRVSIEIGGDEVNMRLLAVLRHACKMGYMDEL